MSSISKKACSIISPFTQQKISWCRCRELSELFFLSSYSKVSFNKENYFSESLVLNFPFFKILPYYFSIDLWNKYIHFHQLTCSSRQEVQLKWLIDIIIILKKRIHIVHTRWVRVLSTFQKMALFSWTKQDRLYEAIFLWQSFFLYFTGMNFFFRARRSREKNNFPRVDFFSHEIKENKTKMKKKHLCNLYTLLPE